MSTLKMELVKHMEDMFLFEFDEDVTENTDLFKAGILDSYGYLKLMRFVQETFGVRFSREELLTKVVTTVAGIIELVESKLEQASVTAAS